MIFKTRVRFRIITYKEVICAYEKVEDIDEVYEDLENRIEEELDRKGYDCHTVVVDKESEMKSEC